MPQLQLAAGGHSDRRFIITLQPRPCPKQIMLNSWPACISLKSNATVRRQKTLDTLNRQKQTHLREEFNCLKLLTVMLSVTAKYVHPVLHLSMLCGTLGHVVWSVYTPYFSLTNKVLTSV